ncbi:MAG: sodium-dependent transporter [Oscillospiraceae bacterium]|nr:sodium-dependent transporter [Oscillospiraceae bacterium]
MEKTNREGFASNFGFIMAAVGSAVGLGNIWGFPYKMGLNGGFAFLIVYLLLAIFVGLAVMVGELVIGRKTGMSPVAAYRKLSKKFAFLGYMAIACPFLILCFYMVLGGMVMRYAGGYLLAMFGVDTWAVADISTFFGSFICNGTSMVLWTLIFIAINAVVVAAGIGGGIEKFCNIGMPCLFVMLLIIIVYVAVQPGAVGGYQFMFGLNLEPLKADFLKVLKTAAGQMFFSLSLGMGAIITYGSYLGKQEKIQKNAVIIVVMDTLVAIMAGMVVMPACYAFLDGNTTGGPGLLFASMQMVFANMGGFIGNLMGFLFYFLVFIAAISSSMSLLEALTSSRIDANVEKGKAPNRKAIVIIFCVLVAIFALPNALDGLGNGIAGGATIATPAELFGMTEAVKGWNDCWLDFYDMLSEGLLMPIGAMIMAFAIGWIWKMDFVVEECEASGCKFWGKAFFNICYKFITPIGMLVVIYGQITSYFF